MFSAMFMRNESEHRVCSVFCISSWYFGPSILEFGTHETGSLCLQSLALHTHTHTLSPSLASAAPCLQIVMTGTWARCLFSIVIVSYMAFSVRPMNQINRNDKKLRQRTINAQCIHREKNREKNQENIQTKMSWTVANRAFHCTIISFKIRLHQLGYAVLINKAHKCQTLTRGRNNQIFNYSSNNNTKITKETLLLLLRWEYKYFFFVSVVYAIASDRFFDFFLFSLPRIICCFPKPMPLKYMYRSSCCAVRNVIYPYFWFDRSFGFTVLPSSFFP